MSSPNPPQIQNLQIFFNRRY